MRFALVIADLAYCVTFEPQIGLVQEFWRHSEICLGCRQLLVPHIDRQLRQQFLYVLPFAIPRCQSMDCRRVTQVMKARLATWTTFAADTRVYPDLLESS